MSRKKILEAAAYRRTSLLLDSTYWDCYCFDLPNLICRNCPGGPWNPPSYIVETRGHEIFSGRSQLGHGVVACSPESWLLDSEHPTAESAVDRIRNLYLIENIEIKLTF